MRNNVRVINIFCKSWCECNMDVEKKNCPLPQSALILLCFIGARNNVRVINIFCKSWCECNMDVEKKKKNCPLLHAKW